jgi:hypothetical protein
MRMRLLENLHLPLWLVKDICWAMMWRPLGLIMIVPTISLAIFFVIRSRKVKQEFYPNLSIACWISANSVWMLDEFYALGIREFCLVFFSAGLISIIWWLIRYFPKAWKRREVIESGDAY